MRYTTVDLERFHIYQNLAGLNELPTEAAESLFLSCCQSGEWARQMSEARPFIMVENLFERAGQIWLSLTPKDWLDVIGSKFTSKAAISDQAVLTEDEVHLAQAARLYEEKFGFIFLPDIGGKNAAASLRECLDRLANSPEIELRNAVQTRQKITEKGLNLILEK
ncbi:MAG: 2-oxo-4-hydroxy-4-carboxy-5-ureidoimidazoline decarboxylase [Pyrinomonadaceae bacterium]